MEGKVERTMEGKVERTMEGKVERKDQGKVERTMEEIIRSQTTLIKINQIRGKKVKTEINQRRENPEIAMQWMNRLITNNPNKDKPNKGKKGKDRNKPKKGKSRNSNAMDESTYNKLWCFDLSLEQILEKC